MQKDNKSFIEVVTDAFDEYNKSREFARDFDPLNESGYNYYNIYMAEF